MLRTHGWGGSRERGQGTRLPGRDFVDTGAGTLARLLAEGYVVVTWDQRGFGCSGGEIRINDPDVEGCDVRALIDWAVENAPVATDASGDPVVGMSGGSYAAGIQTMGAAVDPRVDAIAPEISWSDLRYALYSGSVLNQGWVTLLYGYGTGSGTALVDVELAGSVPVGGQAAAALTPGPGATAVDSAALPTRPAAKGALRAWAAVCPAWPSSRFSRPRAAAQSAWAVRPAEAPGDNRRPMGETGREPRPQSRGGLPWRATPTRSSC